MQTSRHARQQSNTDQQMSFRNRWSSRTSSRIASGSWSRCHRHSSRPRALALSFRRGSTCGLDRIGGRTEFMRGEVCDGPGLASSVRGMPCCPTQVSGRGVCMAGRRASLGHRDLATRPGAGLLGLEVGAQVLLRGDHGDAVAQTFGRDRIGPGDEIVLSIMEHHSNIVPWHFLRERQGAVIKWAPVDDEGNFLIDEFEKAVLAEAESAEPRSPWRS